METSFYPFRVAAEKKQKDNKKTFSVREVSLFSEIHINGIVHKLLKNYFERLLQIVWLQLLSLPNSCVLIAALAGNRCTRIETFLKNSTAKVNKALSSIMHWSLKCDAISYLKMP